jgi:hypothetical protein
MRGKSPPASSRFASSSTPSPRGFAPKTPTASYRVSRRAAGALDSGKPRSGFSPQGSELLPGKSRGVLPGDIFMPKGV